MRETEISINRRKSDYVKISAASMSQYQTDKDFREKRDKEKAMNKLNTSGNNPILIEKGKQDRLAWLSIEGNFYNIEGITGKYNLVSYHYGYTALASRTLAVSIPEKKYTDDSLRMIGYNDAQDENIVFEELPEAVRECAAYLEGYKLGLEKSKTKKAK